MISSIVWVPAGVADPSPKRYEMNAQELEILQLLQEQEDKGGDGGDKPKHMRGGLQVKTLASPAAAISSTTIPNTLPADLRMDEYSSDEDEGAAVGKLMLGQSSMLHEEVDDDASEDGRPASREDDDDSSNDNDSESEDDLEDVPDTREFEPVDLEGLQSMGLNQIGNSAMHMDGLGEEDEGSEAENVELTKDDAIILVAKTEDDFAAIEVHVYDKRTGNLYVHHDIPLPSFPLCLAHGRVSTTGTLGNYCAVGTFNPGIEIWNLDVLNALEPTCMLGGEDTRAADELMKREMLGGKMPSRSGGGRDGVSLRPGSHTDAVMSLSWNPIHQQVIASGSADKTVKLWDVTKADSDSGECNATTFSHHRGKVQSVQWHPKEGTLLATGSYDRTIGLLDARTSGDSIKRVKIQSDCEALAWDPFHPEYLTVACEDGSLICWDVRKFETNSPSWSVLTNEFGGLNDLAYNPIIPGMIATCSIDKTVTVWDTYENGSYAASSSPKQCMTKDMCSGKLYTVGFYQSAAWLMGCGGSGKQLALWHLDSEDRLKQRFSGRRSNEEVSETETANDESEAKNDEGVAKNANEDFEAMMAEKEPSTPVEKSTDKKKAGSSKKKAHRKAR